MKFLIMSFLGMCTSALVADMPHDAPGKLRNPEYWSRCNPNSNIPREACESATDTALHSSKCINKAEWQYARDHGVAVMCLGEEIVAACPCSCFDESTQLLSQFNEINQPHWVNIKDFKSGTPVVTASEQADLDEFKLTQNSTSYKTEGSEKSLLYVLKTQNAHLKVTGTHAILMSDGTMRAAKDLKVSDKLFSFTRASQEILTIDRSPATEGIVHNMLVDTQNKKEHLIVAKDVESKAAMAVGDLLWQNSLSQDLDAVLIRR